MVAAARRGLRAGAAAAGRPAAHRRRAVGRRADRRDGRGQHRADAARRLRPLAPRRRNAPLRIDRGEPVLAVRRGRGRRERRGAAHVLSTIRPEGLPSWGFDLPTGAGTYRALYPYAWFDVDWAELPVRVVQRQFSPVIAHNYRESSLPVGVFETTIENRSDEPLTVGLMFSWQNVLGRSSGLDVAGGQRHEAVRRDGLAGVVMGGPGAAAGTAGDGTFALLGVEETRRRAHRDAAVRGRGRRRRAVGGLRDRRPPLADRRVAGDGRAVRRAGRRRDRGDDLAGPRRVADDPVRPRLGRPAGAVRDRDALAPPLHGVLRDVRAERLGDRRRGRPLPRGVGGRDRRLAGADPRRPGPPRLVQGRALQRALLHGRRRHALDRRPADRCPSAPTARRRRPARPTPAARSAGSPRSSASTTRSTTRSTSTSTPRSRGSSSGPSSSGRSSASSSPRSMPTTRRSSRSSGAASSPRGNAPARCPTTSAGRSTTRCCA